MPRCMIQWREEHTWSVVEKREKDDDSHGPAVDWEWTRELTQKSTHLKGNCQLVCNPVRPYKEVKILSLHLMLHSLHVNGRWGWWQLDTKTHYSHSRVCQTLLSLLPVIPNSKWWKMKLHIYEFISLSKEPHRLSNERGILADFTNFNKRCRRRNLHSTFTSSKTSHKFIPLILWKVSSFKSLAGSQERQMFVRYCFDW